MSRSTAEIGDVLRSIDLFAGLGAERIAWLASRAQERELEDGEAFVQVGDPASHWHVLATGGIDWFLPVDGVETLSAHMDAVTYTGMTSCLTGEPIGVTGRATGPTTLLRFDEPTLFALVGEEPGVLREVVRQFRPVFEVGQAITRQRDKLAALGSLSAGLAHEINNPAAAARRAADELGRSLDVLRGGAKRLAGLGPAQLDRLGHLACGNARGEVGGDPLEVADREDELAEWLAERGVAESWEVAGELANAGLDASWAAEIEEASGERLADVLPWAAAGATSGGLVGELNESLRRVSELVGAIKAYSYMDQAPSQDLDVREGLDNTLTILAHKLKTAGVTVVRDYAADLPRISGSGSELNQVWTNLIDNAIAAAPPGGHLTLATALVNGHVQVTIADDGPGIPPEIQERIFEPFFTTKPVGEGTGLGLDVAWRIVVTNHGGRLRVRSEPGDTRFEVSLPA